MTIFEVALESFIDMNHELVLLSKQIDWDAVESEFAQYYCVDNGRPSVPIRKMVGMMLLKNIYNLSDEGVVARWMENPYMQYFTGEKVFQKRPPMNPIDMTKFRKRIGADGAEKIFTLSLMVNAKEITAKEMKMVMIDSTVQEKNITFPTDAKLYRKIIAKVLDMSRREAIELRRTYAACSSGPDQPVDRLHSRRGGDRPRLSWKEMGGCHGDQHPVEREARAELLPETESKEEVQQASRHRAGNRPPEIRPPDDPELPERDTR